MNPNIKPTTIFVLRLRNALIRTVFIVLALLLAAWFLIGCRVKTISVENLRYTPEPTVLDAAGIRAGRHLYAISEKKLTNSLCAESPYIRSVSLKRTLPSGITICVEEYELAYYVEFEGFCYLLSSELLILEETTPDKARSLGAAPLQTLPIQAPKLPKDAPEGTPVKLTVGEKLAFKTKSDFSRTQTMLTAIRSGDFAQDITAVDLSDPFELTITVSDKYKVILGNEKHLTEKISRVQGALRYLTENMYGITGTLYARSDAPVTFEITGVISQQDA